MRRTEPLANKNSQQRLLPADDERDFAPGSRRDGEAGRGCGVGICGGRRIYRRITIRAKESQGEGRVGGYWRRRSIRRDFRPQEQRHEGGKEGQSRGTRNSCRGKGGHW